MLLCWDKHYTTTDINYIIHTLIQMGFIHKFIITDSVHQLFTTSANCLLFLDLASPKKRSPPMNRGTATKTNCYMRNMVYSEELCKNAFLFFGDSTGFSNYFILITLYANCFYVFSFNNDFFVYPLFRQLPPCRQARTEQPALLKGNS